MPFQPSTMAVPVVPHTVVDAAGGGLANVYCALGALAVVTGIVFMQSDCPYARSLRHGCGDGGACRRMSRAGSDEDVGRRHERAGVHGRDAL